MKVTYDYGFEGANDATDNSVVFGKKYGTNVPNEAKAESLSQSKGYEFEGWYYGEITSGSKVMMDEDHTLTARWEPKTLTVSFDSGADCGFMDPVDPILVKYGENYGGLPIPKSNKLYEFSHWKIIDGSGTDYGKCTSDTVVKQKAGHTLRAVWKNSRNVGFIMPDGTEITRNLTKYFGQRYGFAPHVSRTGYTVKWYFHDENSPYNGMEYTPDMLVHPDHPVVVKGEYVPLDITVTFDYSCGFATTDPLSETMVVHYGDTYQLPENPVCEEGYDFEGWDLLGENGEYLGSVESGDTVTTIENHTIAASWCTIHTVYLYNDIKKSELLDVIMGIKYGSTYHFLPDMEREGYDFKGWYFIGGSQAYNNKRCNKTDRVIPAHPVNLYPLFKAKNVNVVYNSDGGVYNAESMKYTYDGDAVITKTYNSPYTILAPTKEENIFVDWYYDEAHTQPIGEDDLITNPETHTVYAGWAKSVVVSFDSGEGASVCDPIEVGIGLPYGELPVPVSDNHYIFEEWELVDSDGEVIDSVTPETIVTTTENHRLVAFWTKTRYLTLDVNGGDIGSVQTRRLVTFGQNYPVLPAPTKDGYEFIGWFFNGDGEFDGVKCTCELMAIPEHPANVVAMYTAINDVTEYPPLGHLRVSVFCAVLQDFALHPAISGIPIGKSPKFCTKPKYFCQNTCNRAWTVI